jgi:hypothetical protein
MSRNEVINLAAEGITVVLRDICDRVRSQGELERPGEASASRATALQRTLVTSGRVCPANEGPVVEQGAVELGVWALRAGEPVQIEPGLPASSSRAAEVTLGQTGRAHIKQHGHATECETTNRLGDTVANTRQRAQRKLFLRHFAVKAVLERPRHVAKDRRPCAKAKLL